MDAKKHAEDSRARAVSWYAAKRAKRLAARGVAPCNKCNAGEYNLSGVCGNCGAIETDPTPAEIAAGMAAIRAAKASDEGVCKHDGGRALGIRQFTMGARRHGAGDNGCGFHFQEVR